MSNVITVLLECVPRNRGRGPREKEGEEARGREEKEEKKRLEMCQALAPAPRDDCHGSALQTHTNNKKSHWKISKLST